MPAATLLLVMIFMISVYSPVDVYVANKNEFWFDLPLLLPVLLKYSIYVYFIGLIILAGIYLINKYVFDTLVKAIFIIFIYLYIQGTLFLQHLPPLDGTFIDWEDYKKDIWISYILLFLCLALGIYIFHKYDIYAKQIILYISAAVFMMQFVALITVIIENHGFEKKEMCVVTDTNEYVISTEQNYIIVMLDAVDGATFNYLVNDSGHNQKVFEDFTFYNNMMGAYPFTDRAVPFVFSGKWYENTEPYEAWYKSSFEESRLINMMKKNGYSLGLYETALPTLISYNPINQEEVSFITSEYMLFFKEVKFSLFRCAPYSAKKFFMDDISNFIELQGNNQNIKPLEFWSSNIQMYNTLSESGLIKAKEKMFKFIHLDGAHVPFNFNKDLQRIDEADGTYEQEIEGCITLLDKLIRELKDNSAYDNSVIVIMSDHGYIWDPEFDYGRQNPLFMVKGRNEHHEFRVSEAPVSFDDLQIAFERLENGNLSDEIFDWKEGDQRDRRFLFFKYLEEDHMVEYIQKGDAWNPETMSETGRVYDLQ